MEQQREVATQEATAFAEANKISFLETSALNGQNVTQAFENLLSMKPSSSTSPSNAYVQAIFIIWLARKNQLLTTAANG